MIALAEFLEAAGFDAVWVGESLLARPRPEPLAVLSAIAARTRRIAVGTAVLLPAMRHPLQLAQQAATVDLLAGGRLRLGVGTGFPNEQTRRELEPLGITFGERIARCHEVVAWCRQRGERHLPIKRSTGSSPASRYFLGRPSLSSVVMTRASGSRRVAGATAAPGGLATTIVELMAARMVHFGERARNYAQGKVPGQLRGLASLGRENTKSWLLIGL